jgi:hypothetical protein
MINTEKYILPETNYIKSETIKKQIIIGHTGSKNMNHYNKWIHRLNGKYLKTASYSIDFDGNIFQHYDPIYTSKVLENNDLDNRSIFILLENEGWLMFDNKKNHYINWVGDIYKRDLPIVEKRWRGYTYWAPYSEEQFNSTLYLANKLCEEFYIPKFAIAHNTKMDTPLFFDGIIYKSNIDKHYNDLSPAWDFEKFKNRLENE